jgi:hypothetical protein
MANEEQGYRDTANGCAFELRFGIVASKATESGVVERTRLVDRRGDRYAETVRDRASGAVLRHVDHALRDHTDRGSAKPELREARYRRRGARRS